MDKLIYNQLTSTRHPAWRSHSVFSFNIAYCLISTIQYYLYNVNLFTRKDGLSIEMIPGGQTQNINYMMIKRKLWFGVIFSSLTNHVFVVILTWLNWLCDKLLLLIYWIAMRYILITVYVYHCIDVTWLWSPKLTANLQFGQFVLASFIKYRGST